MVTHSQVVGSNLKPLGLTLSILSAFLEDTDIGPTACLSHTGLMGQEGGRSSVGHTPDPGWPATPHRPPKALSLTSPQQQVLT